MADSGHPPAELHERLLICRTIKLNAGTHGGHRRCCHAQIQKNAQNKPQIARLILCVHTTLQFYCNLFLTFCGSFRTFSLRSPAAHLPANSLFTLPHSPPLVNDFFPYFQLFSTLCNPCQNLGLYLPCHRTLFLPLTFMIHYSYIGRMLDRVRHGVDSPKAFCFCPIPSTPQKFLSPAFSAGVCAIGGHDIYFVLTDSSSSCGSTMPYHDISMISLFHVAYPLLCLHPFFVLHSS